MDHRRAAGEWAGHCDTHVVISGAHAGVGAGAVLCAGDDGGSAGICGVVRVEIIAELPNCGIAELHAARCGGLNESDSKSTQLKIRTKLFAIRVVGMFEKLPKK